MWNILFKNRPFIHTFYTGCPMTSLNGWALNKNRHITLHTLVSKYWCVSANPICAQSSKLCLSTAIVYLMIGDKKFTKRLLNENRTTVTQTILF